MAITCPVFGDRFRCRQSPLSIRPGLCRCLGYFWPAEYFRRHSAQHPWQRSAIVTALKIVGRGFPGSSTPPGWRPCILEYRRHNRVEPVLQRVSRTCEPRDVLYLYPALAASIMEWDSKLERMLAGNPAPAFAWPLPAAYPDDSVGTYTGSILRPAA